VSLLERRFGRFVCEGFYWGLYIPTLLFPVLNAQLYLPIVAAPA
jgi:hypothetical protein